MRRESGLCRGSELRCGSAPGGDSAPYAGASRNSPALYAGAPGNGSAPRAGAGAFGSGSDSAPCCGSALRCGSAPRGGSAPRSVFALALPIVLAVALAAGCGATSSGGGTDSAPAYERSPEAPFVAEDAAAGTSPAMAINAEGAAQLGGGSYAGNMAGAPASDAATAAAADGAGAETAIRKEIKNGYASLEVKDASEAYAAIMGIASDLGGYEFDRSESRSDSGAHISLTLKLLPESLAEFEARVRGAVGDSVESWSIGSEDITAEYYDASARLESMRRALRQYEDLLGTARSVSDILEIRREITALQADIDSMQGMVGMWDALVRYATFHMQIRQLQAPLAPARSAEWSFSSPPDILSAMRNGFVTTGNVLYRVLVWLAVALVSLLPLLVPAALAVAAVIAVRKRRKRRNGAGGAGAALLDAPGAKERAEGGGKSRHWRGKGEDRRGEGGERNGNRHGDQRGDQHGDGDGGPPEQ